MFGKNEIVGRSHFEGTEALLVTSIFVTFQGEGPFTGRPAVFLRLAKCNLACSFCDTYFDRGDWYSPKALLDQIDLSIKEYYGGSSPEWLRIGGGVRNILLVVTGGEPSLQPALVPFLNHLVGLAEFRQIQIESNGILPFDGLHQDIHLVVSPKCGEKGGWPTRYLTPNKRTLQRADSLKFVLSADPTSPYHTIPEWAFDWRQETGRSIYVSPMNMYQRKPERAVEESDNFMTRSTVNEVISFWEPGLLDQYFNRRNHEWAGEYAVANGCILSLQSHLYCSVA